MSLFPMMKAENLEKEGGSCWIPSKAREDWPSAWRYLLEVNIVRKPNVYFHLLLKHVGGEHRKGQSLFVITS